ncbi:MAG: class I poly(R)-hydroxyalkanoic acid synthase [Hyphomicrobiales bacterium]|nr:class I poly(R)-hydroxyalkanoic acid synthase [Hyphomicrobiales bacterium]
MAAAGEALTESTLRDKRPPPRARKRTKAADAAPAAPLPAPNERPAVPSPLSAPADAPLAAPQAQTPAPAPAPKPSIEKPAATALRETPLPNFELLARNAARLVEEGGKVLAAYIKPLEAREAAAAEPSSEITQVVATLGRVAEYYLSDAKRAFEAQTALSNRFVDLWAATLLRLQGEEAPPVAQPEPGDKRFADPEWRTNPYFDFLKQAYVLTSRWAKDLVERADDLDPHTRHKAQFYLRQVTSALSPSNFVATNPELLRATLAESGENLVRGLSMMAEDIAAGGGALRIRQSDARKFTLGVNLAATPGKVVFRNELIELIQYAPTTPGVHKRPLLIVPPWINKFYVLDLNPEKSFIRWAVAQGLTVFVVSWVNPDERHAEKGFEAYMREGVFAALDAIEAATGEREVAAIGYCVGGTLLAITLAYMAEIGDKRIANATFFTTQVDFKDAGDLKVFVDAEQLKAIELKMEGAGYLEGAQMANAFNMLRPEELIWSYFVNNYLKGKEPMPFDLLVWNADSTRMPAANHKFYLRHCYLQNDLTRGEMTIEGCKLDLGKVTIPVYDLAAREDHIAPAKSVFTGAKHFGGPVRYVLAGSGHIAGVVNPADKPKYQYWTGGQPAGAFEDWLGGAEEHPGSWWVDWAEWVKAQAPEQVAPREPGAGKLKPLGDAPGEYVRVRS